MFDNAPVEVLKKSSQGLFQTFKIYLSNPNNTTNKVFCIIMLKPLLKVMLLMMMMIYIYIYMQKLSNHAKTWPQKGRDSIKLLKIGHSKPAQTKGLRTVTPEVPQFGSHMRGTTSYYILSAQIRQRERRKQTEVPECRTTNYCFWSSEILNLWARFWNSHTHTHIYIYIPRWSNSPNSWKTEMVMKRTWKWALDLCTTIFEDIWRRIRL